MRVGEDAELFYENPFYIYHVLLFYDIYYLPDIYFYCDLKYELLHIKNNSV